MPVRGEASDRPWRVAVVVPKYGLVGGGERFVFELTERLAQDPRFEIHLFAHRWRGVSGRVTVHRVPMLPFPKWLGPLSFAWFADRLIARLNGVDLIHGHDRLLRADLCSMHFVPHRFWIREIRKKWLASLFDRATCWLEERMFTGPKPCRAVLPVSTLAREQLAAAYDLGSTLVEVVHPGVGEEYLKGEDQGARQDLRRELGIRDQDFVLLFVGMNFELKGLDLLLQAVGRLKERGRQGLKVLVVGKGDEPGFQSRADRLGIGDDLRFAGVRMEMPRVYPAGDLFLLLSGFDTFGMVVTEAMAAGLPVIVSPQVGAKDLIRQGENGFVVERTAIDEIASRIAWLLDHPERYQAMRAQARETAATLSWDLVAARVAAIYERLIVPSVAPPPRAGEGKVGDAGW